MVGNNAASKAGVYSRHLLQHNRITIPKPLISEFKLKYTDKVTLVSQGGKIVVEPVSATPVAPLTKKTHRKTYKSKRKSSTASLKNKQHRRSLKQALALTN